MNRCLPLLVVALVCVCAFLAPRATAAGEQVFFAFDDRSLPFQLGVELKLVGFGTGGRSLKNAVIRPGPPGSPDSRGVYYYGSVAKVKDEYYMWYLGAGDQETVLNPYQNLHICFARSKDGLTWEKPALGLVEYGGNKHNNLVDMGSRFPVQECVVFHEPDEPDPSRRFKMAFEANKYKIHLAVAYSADGVTWKESPHNPVGPRLEPSGLIKWNGAYHLCAQGFTRWNPGREPWTRELDTYVSYDFEHWTLAAARGFRRDPVPPRPVGATGMADGEQVHLGASLWNRGNVILGLYGQWHGHPSNDRRFVSIDLGLVISHDALHYYEPVPDFRMVEAKETTYHLGLQRAPALAQGQGFENVGDKTLFWYAPWDELMDAIRVATWDRDRLGFLQPLSLAENRPPHVISKPIPTDGRSVAIDLNIGGLGNLSKIKVSILNEQFMALPGFGPADCTGPVEPGLRQRVTWGTKQAVASDGPIRVRIDFSGARPEDLKLYAVYVSAP